MPQNVVVPPFDEAPQTVVGSTPQAVFAFDFPFWDAEDILVYVDGVLVDPSDYEVTGSPLQGGELVEGGYGSGEVTFAEDVFDCTVTIDRQVTSPRETQFARTAPLDMKALNGDLNRITARQQDLDRHTMRRPLDLAPGQFVTINADGEAVASDGTGADDGLRTDIAATTGASLVGTTAGGSVQTALDQAQAGGYRYNRDFPPGCAGVYYGDVWPNSVYPMVAVRMGDPAVGDYILVRVWHDGLVDEYVLRDPQGYPSLFPVAGGWMLWARAAYVRDRYKKWWEAPSLMQGAISNSDWAIRIGPYDQPYATGLDGPVWAYCGFGHGRAVNIPANNQIQVDGAGANLQSLVNWPVGVKKFGQKLVIQSNFKLRFYADATERVSLDYTQNFGKDGTNINRGYIALTSFQALTANVGWQDSTSPMFAAQRSVYVTHAKLSGLPAVTLNGDGVQKGNWNNPGPTGDTCQFYAEGDPTIVDECFVGYGPPLRINGVNASPWVLNRYGRVHVTDDSDNVKFRVYMNSSEQVLPRNADEMVVGTVYQTYAQYRTMYRPSGPS